MVVVATVVVATVVVATVVVATVVQNCPSKLIEAQTLD